MCDQTLMLYKNGKRVMKSSVVTGNESNGCGSIYKYNGSHGCVNMPTGSARKLYNKVSVGTKVIIRK